MIVRLKYLAVVGHRTIVSSFYSILFHLLEHRLSGVCLSATINDEHLILSAHVPGVLPATAAALAAALPIDVHPVHRACSTRRPTLANAHYSTHDVGTTIYVPRGVSIAGAFFTGGKRV
jgi:hypothetical protein